MRERDDKAGRMGKEKVLKGRKGRDNLNRQMCGSEKNREKERS